MTSVGTNQDPCIQKKKRLTFTSCKMPPASTETKTSTCGDEGWLGSIIQAPDVQEFFPVQPRFDKQVSAWVIRSINPTPSAEDVEEISLLNCVFCIRDRDPGGPSDEQRCVYDGLSSAVCQLCVSELLRMFLSPVGASNDLLSPPLCLFL